MPHKFSPKKIAAGPFPLECGNINWFRWLFVVCWFDFCIPYLCLCSLSLSLSLSVCLNYCLFLWALLFETNQVASITSSSAGMQRCFSLSLRQILANPAAHRMARSQPVPLCWKKMEVGWPAQASIPGSGFELAISVLQQYFEKPVVCHEALLGGGGCPISFPFLCIWTEVQTIQGGRLPKEVRSACRAFILGQSACDPDQTRKPPACWSPWRSQTVEIASCSLSRNNVCVCGGILLCKSVKVVHIASWETELDHSAVSAFVDLEPRAHQGRLISGQGFIHGWHAAVVHHHARCHSSHECPGHT